MYTVSTDAGNVYVHDAENNLVSFKDSDVILSIQADNSVITGDDDAVAEIVNYCNNYSEEEAEVIIPDYLQPDEVAKTAITD